MKTTIQNYRDVKKEIWQRRELLTGSFFYSEEEDKRTAQLDVTHQFMEEGDTEFIHCFQNGDRFLFPALDKNSHFGYSYREIELDQFPTHVMAVKKEGGHFEIDSIESSELLEMLTCGMDEEELHIMEDGTILCEDMRVAMASSN